MLFLTYCISSVLRWSLFYFQNDPKNLDPSYKMDLDLWDCLGRVKLILQQNYIELIYLFVVNQEMRKSSFYIRINMVGSNIGCEKNN